MYMTCYVVRRRIDVKVCLHMCISARVPFPWMADFLQPGKIRKECAAISQDTNFENKHQTHLLKVAHLAFLSSKMFECLVK